MATSRVNKVSKIQKDFTPTVKEIKYLSKTFPEFRRDLIEFAKVYFPNTYADFNESSPGMMFIEMASYIGDVLSYYIDAQYRENLLTHATERSNILAIAQAFGFKPKPAGAANTTLDVYQICPSSGSGGQYVDDHYLLHVAPNATFTSTAFGSVDFRNPQAIDFRDPIGRSETVFSVDANNVPTTYLIKKRAKVSAGTIKTITRAFADPTKFSKITLSDQNVLGIISITDDNGNLWSEVDYLAQDIVIDETELTQYQFDDFLEDQDDNSTTPVPPKMLQFKSEPYRYSTRYNEDFQLEIIFGSGVVDDNNENVTLDVSKIASSEFTTRQSSTSLDPADFLANSTFGRAPSNTTLTITYVVGGGIESNVPAGTITQVSNVNVLNTADGFSTAAEKSLFSDAVTSIACNNVESATGGRGAETVEEIRQNAFAFFNAQNRVVTAEDYVVRSYAMPPQFGSVSKAFVLSDDQLQLIQEAVAGTGGIPVEAQLVAEPAQENQVNLYVLGYDRNKIVRRLNKGMKTNLKEYLARYAMVNDLIAIHDAFVVNVGVEFRVGAFKNYNLNDVLARCIDATKDFFDIDKWQINQPIVLSDLYTTLAQIDGVKSVIKLKVFNKYAADYGTAYEPYRYDIDTMATVRGDDEWGIIYPSIDPMIFEMRFPDQDIVGSAVL